MVAASCRLNRFGFGTARYADVTVYDAKAAGAIAMTSSPMLKSCTPSPTATTVPAHSEPKEESAPVTSGSRASAFNTSRKFSPVAATSITISFDRGRGLIAEWLVRSSRTPDDDVSRRSGPWLRADAVTTPLDGHSQGM